MEFADLEKHLGFLGALAFAVLQAFIAIQKMKARKTESIDPKPRTFLLEEATEIFKEHLVELRALRSEVAPIAPMAQVVLAQDQETGAYKIWPPTAMLKRTHETVGNMNEAVEELTKNVAALEKKVGNA